MVKKSKIISNVLFLFLFGCPDALFAQQGEPETVRVKIQVIEDDTRKITPVMVCITNVRNSQAHVPPSGDKAGTPTEVELFMKGVDFKSDKNWVGPIRMTNGRGNNRNRSGLYELSPSIPHWREPVMYQTSGNFTIDLLPGTWRISLAHGTEYIPLTEEFIVSGAEKRLTKSFLLKRWINLPQRGWYSGDVHVHHPTNKPQFRKYLLDFAKAEDVHMVNMLEMGHHLGTDFKLEGFGKKFRICKGSICLVSGQEDPRSAYGHIIGLNITDQVRDTSVYYYYDRVFKELHRQPGALVGYAHFSWSGFWKGFPWHVTTGEIDFVELLQFLRLNTVDYYDYLNLGFRITAAAGSDFPWASTMGDVRTFVYTGNEFSADGWFEGLKAGHTFVTNGPALFLEADGKLPGSEIVKSNGSSIALKARAISNSTIGQIDRMAIYNNEGLVIEKVNGEKLDSIDITLAHAVIKSQWLAAVVYCDNGAVAHTTPIYVVVDGKPTWDKQKAPDIIEKQLKAIRVIEDEEKAKPTIDQGILTRLESAQEFYAEMLQQIKRDE